MIGDQVNKILDGRYLSKDQLVERLDLMGIDKSQHILKAKYDFVRVYNENIYKTKYNKLIKDLLLEDIIDNKADSAEKNKKTFNRNYNDSSNNMLKSMFTKGGPVKEKEMFLKKSPIKKTDTIENLIGKKRGKDDTTTELLTILDDSKTIITNRTTRSKKKSNLYDLLFTAAKKDKSVNLTKENKANQTSNQVKKTISLVNNKETNVLNSAQNKSKSQIKNDNKSNLDKDNKNTKANIVSDNKYTIKKQNFIIKNKDLNNKSQQKNKESNQNTIKIASKPFTKATGTKSSFSVTTKANTSKTNLNQTQQSKTIDNTQKGGPNTLNNPKPKFISQKSTLSNNISDKKASKHLDIIAPLQKSKSFSIAKSITKPKQSTGKNVPFDFNNIMISNKEFTLGKPAKNTNSNLKKISPPDNNNNSYLKNLSNPQSNVLKENNKTSETKSKVLTNKFLKNTFKSDNKNTHSNNKNMNLELNENVNTELEKYDIYDNNNPNFNENENENAVIDYGNVFKNNDINDDNYNYDINQVGYKNPSVMIKSDISHNRLLHGNSTMQTKNDERFMDEITKILFDKEFLLKAGFSVVSISVLGYVLSKPSAIESIQSYILEYIKNINIEIDHIKNLFIFIIITLLAFLIMWIIKKYINNKKASEDYNEIFKILVESNDAGVSDEAFMILEGNLIKNMSDRNNMNAEEYSQNIYPILKNNIQEDNVFYFDKIDEDNTFLKLVPFYDNNGNLTYEIPNNENNDEIINENYDNIVDEQNNHPHQIHIENPHIKLNIRHHNSIDNLGNNYADENYIQENEDNN